jgi:hypothetical protein
MHQLITSLSSPIKMIMKKKMKMEIGHTTSILKEGKKPGTR